MPNTLTLNGVQAHWYPRRNVKGYDSLRGVSFSIADCVWVAVIGDNGVGKSTLFHAIAGTVPYVTGAIYVNEVRLLPRDIACRFECGVVHVRQEPTLPPGKYSVTDAVAIATKWRPALKNDQAIEDLISKLREIGIVHEDCCSADAFDFIAGIIAVPRVILLDEIRARLAPSQREFPHHVREPSRGSINPSVQAELCRGAGMVATEYAHPTKVREKHRNFYHSIRPLVAQSIVLFTEHDLKLALDAADMVLWLRDNESPQFGAVADLKQQIQQAAPIEEDPSAENGQSITRAMRVVRGSESVRRQVELAVQCVTNSRSKRSKLLKEILRICPFLGEDRPAETLSGGERVTLAWLLYRASGLKDKFPRQLFEHLSRTRRHQLNNIDQLIEGG